MKTRLEEIHYNVNSDFPGYQKEWMRFFFFLLYFSVFQVASVSICNYFNEKIILKEQFPKPHSVSRLLLPPHQMHYPQMLVQDVVPRTEIGPKATFQAQKRKGVAGQLRPATCRNSRWKPEGPQCRFRNGQYLHSHQQYLLSTDSGMLGSGNTANPASTCLHLLRLEKMLSTWEE